MWLFSFSQFPLIYERFHSGYDRLWITRCTHAFSYFRSSTDPLTFRVKRDRICKFNFLVTFFLTRISLMCRWYRCEKKWRETREQDAGCRSITQVQDWLFFCTFVDLIRIISWRSNFRWLLHKCSNIFLLVWTVNLWF